MSLRKWIQKIHIYGGLICFWYLIIFAISSLHFQHHFAFMNPKQLAGKSEQIHLDKDPGNTDAAIASNIQDVLGIAGWSVSWGTYHDSSGVFHLQIQNPKSQYLITYDRKASTVNIMKNGKGIWTVIISLHGLAGKIRNAPFLIFWNIFTYLSVIVVIFSVFSGIWLWANRSRDKLIGWLTVLGIMSLSIALMVVVYLKG